MESRHSQDAIAPSTSGEAGTSHSGFTDDKVGPVTAAQKLSEDTTQGEQINGSRRGKGLRHWLVLLLHLAIWMLMTGWFATGVALHRDLGWVVPFLVWLGVSVRLLTWHVSTKYVTGPIRTVWKHTVFRAVAIIPPKYRLLLGGLGALAVILVGTFASPETQSNKRSDRAVSLLGLAIALGSFYLTSNNRKAVRFQTVIIGTLAQFLLALFVLRTTVGRDIFSFVASLARTLLSYSAKGTAFLTTPDTAKLTWFLLTVVPPIIFFIALIQVLIHWGVIQWLVGKFATVFFQTMAVSGVEAIVAAASPFIGQGESMMLVKPFIPVLTRAEIHQVMASGFATIAGGVLYAYISMGVNPAALVSSCVMSIPAALAISKLRFPETEETATAGQLVVPEEAEGEKHRNVLHAIASGSGLGIRVAGMVVAGVLCILSLLGLVDGLLGWWGSYFGIVDPSLSVELIGGYLFYPVAFLLGVERNGDLLKVGKLIAMKVIENEFVAYSALQNDAEFADLSPRSRTIATYALCGFGNLASVGVQIAVLGQLAPSRAGDVSKVALSALVTGVVATLTSAAMAGMLIVE